MSYSQTDEESVILRYVRDHQQLPRTFLDIGAFHPTKFSNTRCLVEQGWSGTYVEPAPYNFWLFLNEYGNKDNITLINSPIAREPGIISFFDSSGDAVSTAKPTHAEFWTSKGVKFRQYITKSMSWRELASVIRPPTVVSIDVEGMNLELFESMPIAVWPEIRLIIIEHDRQRSAFLHAAAGHGLRLLSANAINLVFSRD